MRDEQGQPVPMAGLPLLPCPPGRDASRRSTYCVTEAPVGIHDADTRGRPEPSITRRLKER